MTWGIVLQSILKVANTSDSVLLMSRKNCHAPNVHSIVLSKSSDNRLTRVFLVMPDHTLWHNGNRFSAYSVGIHDHQYDLEITSIFGSVTHMLYEQGINRFAEKLYRYQFKSGGCNGDPVVTPMGKELVSPTSVYLLSGNKFLTHDRLHTLSVPEGETAAWMVTEGERRKDTTTLFTNTELVKTAGLYQPFESVDEIVDLVKSVKYPS